MKKYYGVQILRFIAATLVVIDHFVGNILQNWKNSESYYEPYFGAVGVMVFFAISGFVMVKSQYNTFGSIGSAGDFFIRRLIRILPLYAIATTLQYINKINGGPDFRFLNFLKSIFFIPFQMSGGQYRPILGQGWTLNLEMFFYLVFAASLCLPRIKGLLLSVLTFLILALCSFHAEKLNVIFRFYASTILLFFVCGMLVALLPVNALRPKKSGMSTLGVAVIIIIFMTSISHSFDYQVWLCIMLPLVCVVLYLALAYQPVSQGWWVRIMSKLGDASYSTYLFHTFVLGGMKILSNSVTEGQYGNLVALTLLCCVAANLLGLVVYRFIEMPLTNTVKDMALSWIDRWMGVKPSA
ncbi:acyltransferase family protein [Oxalobacteraceae bacterium A2-2]